jgi:hypothetical protein
MTAPAEPSPIPDAYRRVTPCLVVPGAAKALDFMIDPFGPAWTIATHVEDVSPEEMTRRMAALFGSHARRAGPRGARPRGPAGGFAGPPGRGLRGGRRPRPGRHRGRPEPLAGGGHPGPAGCVARGGGCRCPGRRPVACRTRDSPTLPTVARAASAACSMPFTRPPRRAVTCRAGARRRQRRRELPPGPPRRRGR